MNLGIFSLRVRLVYEYENFELVFHQKQRSSEVIDMAHNIRSIGSLFEDLYDSNERPQKSDDQKASGQNHSLQRYGYLLWELCLIFSLHDSYSQDCFLCELHLS